MVPLADPCFCYFEHDCFHHHHVCQQLPEILPLLCRPFSPSLLFSAFQGEPSSWPFFFNVSLPFDFDLSTVNQRVIFRALLVFDGLLQAELKFNLDVKYFA